MKTDDQPIFPEDSETTKELIRRALEILGKSSKEDTDTDDLGDTVQAIRQSQIAHMERTGQTNDSVRSIEKQINGNGNVGLAEIVRNHERQLSALGRIVWVAVISIVGIVINTLIELIGGKGGQ